MTSPRTLVMGCMNVRGCSTIESKRWEIGELFISRRMDVLALNETKMKGKGEVDFGRMKGRVSGVMGGRAREGVAILLSEWLLKLVVEWKEVSSRLMWVRIRLGRECWAFVSAYGPGSEIKEEQRNEFWSELADCVDGLSRRNYVVVLGDLNARVGNEEIEGVLGRYGVPGVNESGERLLDMCVEKELAVGNSFFMKRNVNKYTWMRVVGGRVVERAVMDYMLITKTMIGRVKDIHVFRGVAAAIMSDHFLVEGKVIVAKEWGNRIEGSRREIVKVDELKKPEKKREYQERLEAAYDRVKEREVGELEEEEWKPMKEALVINSREVCGTRYVGGGIRKGSEWWNDTLKKKVEEKRKAFGEWLQHGGRDRYERYRAINDEVKRMVKEAKAAANDRWGQDFGRSFEENKKKFWKELKRIRKSGTGTEETVKDRNGRLLKGDDARRRWAEYFENLLNVVEDREAEIMAVAGVQVPVMEAENEGEITKEEVERALKETKSGKAPGVDGVHAEMLKEGGVTVVEWLVRLFSVCFYLGMCPVEWVLAVIVPLYKGKGDIHECSNSRGISLLSVVGKVYGRVLINRIRDRTEGAISEVQSGFRRGRGCTDQSFVVRQI